MAARPEGVLRRVRSDSNAQPGTVPTAVLIEPDTAVLIEPDTVYREALLTATEQLSDVRLIAGIRDASQAAKQVDESTSIVVMHLPLPEGLRQLELFRRINADVRVIVYGVRDDDRAIIAWAEAGVWACVTHSAALDDLQTAIHAVHRGERWCSSRVAAALFRRVALAKHYHGIRKFGDLPPGGFSLSRREWEILHYVQTGLTNKEIANILCLQPATVKNHLHHVFQKIGVRTREEASRWLDQYDALAPFGEDGDSQADISVMDRGAT